ncbi:protein root UVB sensitive 5 isoform X2 [Nymphaea colorata]|uniref:protein root UVB sensitive 5 isoform X2 n=1 Tax=Nymphaea colorata TaxID=210225 RepID=UPI00129ECE9B|nr:protein root UVB sensitive 5 isoform X2 [Nymphaea colorata]XP_049933781.1 protein root UVB sensitive 5 isoform X2 [Nymphaea colorata]
MCEWYHEKIGRYILDSCSQSVAVVEEHSVVVVARTTEAHSDVKVSWLPRTLKDFILPAGFPGSVSDDYLEYMILQFPTNVTGWICHTLVTSSLLKAVGVTSVSGTAAAASTAAIRWVLKDGLGALGRLFIGGRFGTLFDDDPKQWRMYADFLGSAGSIFELATQLYPSYFLPLASVGNLAKALARGFKDPSFRVIQNHFAISGNLGEVAAKEEVWEVAAQLLGLTIGILFLGTPELATPYPMLVISWLSLRLLHLWLRYQSLMTLKFCTINLKRARILVKSHMLLSIVPGCAECNKEENILIHQSFVKPQILFGSSLSEIIGVKGSVNELKALLELYDGEDYILSMSHRQSVEELKILVSFKVGATSVTVLRSMWQAYWLLEHWEGSNNAFHQLAESLSEVQERFDDFLKKLVDAGWDVKQINIKVPKEFIMYVQNAIECSSAS